LGGKERESTVDSIHDYAKESVGKRQQSEQGLFPFAKKEVFILIVLEFGERFAYRN
jgi:hypothetical protein